MYTLTELNLVWYISLWHSLNSFTSTSLFIFWLLYLATIHKTYKFSIYRKSH